MKPSARLAACSLVAMLLGTASVAARREPSPGTSPSPSTFWVPPADLAPPPPRPVTPPQLPPELRDGATTLTLTQLVDVALRGSPRTRAAWEEAHAAAARLGSERGAYYPQVEANVTASRTRGSAVGGQFVFQSTSISPSVSLAYVIFDSGGRRSAVEEARRELIAANWEHDAAIQAVVLDVETAYYRYVAAKALLAAQEELLTEIRANFDAAEGRHHAGVATIADVLQARTAVAQAQLDRDTTAGLIETVRGALATAVGLPPDTPYDVESPPADAPVAMISEQVHALLEEAQQRRPDLAAARARVEAADAHVREVQAEGRPSLGADISGGEIYFPATMTHPYTYSAALTLHVPVFTGHAHRFDVAEARADAEVARAQLVARERDAATQVWTSYNDLRTAARRVAAVDTLLESASQSHEVASGRYRAGVGTILDLLAAQASLANARALHVQARTDWFLALATLAHDTGTLWLDHSTPHESVGATVPPPSALGSPALGSSTPNDPDPAEASASADGSDANASTQPHAARDRHP